MSHERALARMRTFLYLMAVGLFLGTIAELLMVKHYGESLKLVPFALCGIGIAAAIIAWLRPERLILLAVRVLMFGIMAGSLLGVYEHIEGNLETSKEIHRFATMSERIKQVLTGRNPLAAPGMLAVAALLVIAATYVTNALSAPATAHVPADQREPASLRRSQPI